MTDFGELFFRSIDFFDELIFRETESIVLWSKIWVFKIWLAVIGHVIRWFSLITWSRSSPASLMITEKNIYRGREQLICIVIWAYQCTRWNRTGLYRFRQNWPRNFPNLRTKVERLSVQVATWLVSLFTVTWLVNSNFAPPSIATPHDFAVPSYPRDCFVSVSIQLHQT